MRYDSIFQFDVEQDANVFDPVKLDDSALRSLFSQVIYFAVKDLAFELYKKELGVKRRISDEKMRSAIKYFMSESYEDHAMFVGFRLSGKQVIKLISDNPKKCLDLALAGAAQRTAKIEREDEERFGKMLERQRSVGMDGEWHDAEV